MTYELTPAVYLLIMYAIIVNKWTYTIVHVMFALAEIPLSSHADILVHVHFNKQTVTRHTHSHRITFQMHVHLHNECWHTTSRRAISFEYTHKHATHTHSPPPHTEALLQWMQSLTHVGVQQVDAVQALAAVDSALDSAQGWFAVRRSLRFIQHRDAFWVGNETVDLGIVTKKVTDGAC